MITVTALQHPTTLLRLAAALRQAVRHPGSPIMVRNAAGRPFLMVHYLRGEQAWHVLRKSSGFRATSYTGLRNCTTTLYRVRARPWTTEMAS